MWLTKLKIAIVEKDATSLQNLLNNLPELDNLKDINEAIALLEEASKVLYSLRDEVGRSMHQIQKNLKFLRSTDIPTSLRLDTKF
jgi:hypothetical protein